MGSEAVSGDGRQHLQHDLEHHYDRGDHLRAQDKSGAALEQHPGGRRVALGQQRLLPAHQRHFLHPIQEGEEAHPLEGQQQRKEESGSQKGRLLSGVHQVFH